MTIQKIKLSLLASILLCSFNTYPAVADVANAKLAIAQVEQNLSPYENAIRMAINAASDKRAVVGEWQREALRNFYTDRNFESVWFDDDAKWKRDINPFLVAVENATLEGLNPNDYALKKLANLPANINVKTIAAHDIQITNALLHYIRDLSIGRSQPTEIFPLLFLLPQEKNYGERLARIIQQSQPSDIAKTFQSFSPNHKDYTMLRQSLAQYRDLQQQAGNFETIPEEGVIKPGDKDPRMPVIRERMQLLGKLSGQKEAFANLVQRAKEKRNDHKASMDSPLSEQSKTQKTESKRYGFEDDPTLYGAFTQKAVRAFQKTSGAVEDGIIGSETIRDLNTPLADRIMQIELAMERWRWLPEDLGQKYVFNNIAGFYVRAVEDDKVVIDSPTIIGKVAHQTPAFSSKITDVKFYPDWTVPHSIAHRYLLDKIKADPSVIESLGYEIYNGDQLVPWSSLSISSLTDSDFPPYRFRQKPGPDNALGMVRFSIENDYAIYMHDTSNRSLFDEDTRALSSGCIRVEKREDMAAFLLEGNSDLSASQAREKFSAKGTNLKTEIHPLKTQIPVHITYMTAWIDDEGNTRFENDIYGRDKKLIQALKRQEGEI